MHKILLSLGAVLLITACSHEVAKGPNPSSSLSVEASSLQSSGTPYVVITTTQQQDPTGYVSTPNHSSTILQEEITIPAGKATLLTMKQDNFTAVTEHEPGAKTDTVYWLYISKPSSVDSVLQDTYILSGLVTGDPDTAKKDLLNTATLWKPPFK